MKNKLVIIDTIYLHTIFNMNQEYFLPVGMVCIPVAKFCILASMSYIYICGYDMYVWIDMFCIQYPCPRILAGLSGLLHFVPTLLFFVLGLLCLVFSFMSCLLSVLLFTCTSVLNNTCTWATFSMPILDETNFLEKSLYLFQSFAHQNLTMIVVITVLINFINSFHYQLKKIQFVSCWRVKILR